MLLRNIRTIYYPSHNLIPDAAFSSLRTAI